MTFSDTDTGAQKRAAGLSVALLCMLCAACGGNDSNATTPFVATYESAACEMPLPEGQNPANGYAAG
jgi:hypothetical protein